jgi:predicted transcriptional regulator
MDIPRIFDSEYRLAKIIWEHAPMTTRELVAQAETRLNWKRTTAYTVLKKLCERGIFRMENKTVTVLIPQEQVQVSQGEALINRAFGGSLPGFIAAFAKEKRLSEKDIDEIRRLIDDYERKNGHA